jgi:very-short-patch-repair endonuclease
MDEFRKHNKYLTERARELRKNMTEAESKLWHLFLKKAPVRVLRQKVIGSFIVDFYCKSAGLVIEIDGSHHFFDEGQWVYDRLREDVLEGYGLRVVRFSNEEVMESFDFVCKQIEKELDYL